jgi:hypothetical protein
MSWTHEYEVGQEVKCHFQGQWCRGAICSKRTRSLMVFLGKHGHTNIHDPRNITPWQPSKKKDSSMSPENPSFEF